MLALDRAALESLLGYSFRQAERLESSLTHSSFRDKPGRNEPGAAGSVSNNERLELLGDAVLTLVVTEHLMQAFPRWSVGRLNRAKGRLVSGPALYAAALNLELGRFLQLGPGEEKTGGREKPGVLADAYEAVVAAIYQDGGPEAAAGFIRRTILDAALREGGEVLGGPDPKSALNELLRELGRGQPEYRLLETSGPDHHKTFRVEVHAEGRSLAVAEGPSKKQAELAAAGLALEQLHRDPSSRKTENG